MANYGSHEVLRFASDTGSPLGVFVDLRDVGFNDPHSLLFVPEPTTVALLALGGLAVLRRRSAQVDAKAAVSTR